MSKMYEQNTKKMFELSIQRLRSENIRNYIKKYLNDYLLRVPFQSFKKISVNFQKNLVKASIESQNNGYIITIPWAIHTKKKYIERKSYLFDILANIYLMEVFGSTEFETSVAVGYQFVFSIDPDIKKVYVPKEYRWNLFVFKYLQEFFPEYFIAIKGEYEETKGTIIQRAHQEFDLFYGNWREHGKTTILNWSFQSVAERMKLNRNPTEYDKICRRIFLYSDQIAEIHRKLNNNSTAQYMELVKKGVKYVISRRPRIEFFL